MEISNLQNNIYHILTAIKKVSEELNEHEFLTNYDPDSTIYQITKRVEDAYTAISEVDELLLEL